MEHVTVIDEHIAVTVEQDNGQPVVVVDPVTEAVIVEVVNIVPASNADKNHVHEQLVMSTTWNVNHGLNKFPSPVVTLPDGTEVEAEVVHVDMNNLVVTLKAATTGKVFCN